MNPARPIRRKRESDRLRSQRATDSPAAACAAAEPAAFHSATGPDTEAPAFSPGRCAPSEWLGAVAECWYALLPAVFAFPGLELSGEDWDGAPAAPRAALIAWVVRRRPS